MNNNGTYTVKPLKKDFVNEVNRDLERLQEEINAIVASANVDDIVADLTALNNIDTSTLDNGYKVQVLSDSDHDGNSTLYKLDKNASPVWQYIGEYGTNTYTKEQIDSMLTLKQDLITALNKLSADLVDDSTSNNKFMTAEDKALITADHEAIIGIKNGASIDSFRKVEEALSFKQNKIDGSNKISSDFVDDTNASNKFVTPEVVQQIQNNTSDIADLKDMVLDSTNTSVEDADVGQIVYTNIDEEEE